MSENEMNCVNGSNTGPCKRIPKHYEGWVERDFSNEFLHYYLVQIVIWLIWGMFYGSIYTVTEKKKLKINGML